MTGGPGRSDSTLDAVGIDLARIVVTSTAPGELLFFDDVVLEVRRNGVPRGGKEEALGFGLDLSLLAPYVVAVMPTVVLALKTIVEKHVTDAVGERLADGIRSLFRKDEKPSVPPLTAEQARSVHEVALRTAERLGLRAEKAALLADAVVGAVSVRDA